ncbi:bifunctional aminoglycoside phosphotransferase/ATP-binding protein [Pararhodospirillum oryzae]|uniref:Aminoglycoside phosphotransferase domain-containing protein n=1 Tax=Pararhodospirillum oryzae TaxID=478448 RepID=A0A512HBR9_9PROT|nr:AAA family ATPase [Pararhodospirillum oryzae]GEO82897.1 hypothetical protein ROR02_30280 [Pararhodospirillum oryzae]
MTSDTQSAVIAFLSRPETHGLPPGTPVEVIRTHISVLFLAGERVFKIKRAVVLPYVDHTRLAARAACCQRELALNTPAAPDLYLGVVAITQEPDGTLALDGAGRKVEWAVVMRRFDQEAQLDHLAAAGTLDRHHMCDLAEAIHAAHGRAQPCAERADWLDRTVENNLESLAEQEAVLGAAAVAEVADALTQGARRLRPLLRQRARHGFVRRCHGDLHLGNLVMWHGRPTLFDAIDFNDLFVEIDVLYDLAFVLMDLCARSQRRLASILFNHYMEYAGDTAGLAALPLFLALRATIRAFVAATAASAQTDPDQVRRHQEEAHAYLARAVAFLKPPAPRLVAVGGLSGSGKSRLAREVAPALGAAPGALVLRTDVLRKRLMGLTPYQPLGPEGYTPEVHIRTYALLAAEARTALAAGHGVVLDGVHARPGEREAAEALAQAAQVPFSGLWVYTPVQVAVERIETRVRNPSDVTPEVRANQEKFDLGAVTWTRIDSSGSKDATVKAGLAALGVEAPDGPAGAACLTESC